MAGHATDLTRYQRYATVSGYCFLVSFAATAFGFDQSILNGFIAMPVWLKDYGDTYDAATGAYGISAGRLTSIEGVTLGFAVVGSVLGGYIAAYRGRKFGLVLCGLANFAGPLIQLVPNYAALLVAKVVTGLGIAWVGNFGIAYWSEVAPAELRGSMVLFYQLFINVANLLGACVNQGTHDWPSRRSYQIPVIVVVAFPFLLMCIVWLLPESPRWLIAHGRVDEARTAIRRVRGKHIPQGELDEEIEDCVVFTELEKELDASTSYMECFRGTDLRRTLIAVLMMSGQQFMGVAFFAGFATYFFAIVGFTDAFLITVIVSSCQVAGPVLAFPLVSCVGRRPILVVGAAVSAACMLTFATVAAAAPDSEAASRCVIAFICLFCFNFSLTWGSVAPVVMGEVASNRLRTKTVSVALASSWLVCVAVTCATPYLINPGYADLGTNMGFIFGGLAVLVFVAAVAILPETKDRTLEEIDEMFLNRVSTFKFSSYVCTGQAAGYDRNDLKGGKKEAVVAEVEEA